MFDIFFPLWSDGILGKTTVILLALTIIILSALFMYFLFWLVDSRFLFKQTGVGKVVNKYSVDEYIDTTWIHVNNIWIPLNNTIPKSYYLVLEANNKKGTVEIHKEFYSNVTIGKLYPIVFSTGRISKSLYIDEIY